MTEDSAGPLDLHMILRSGAELHVDVAPGTVSAEEDDQQRLVALVWERADGASGHLLYVDPGEVAAVTVTEAPA